MFSILKEGNSWLFRHVTWLAALAYIMVFCLAPPCLCVDTLAHTMSQIYGEPTTVHPYFSYLFAYPCAFLSKHYPVFAYVPLYLTILNLITIAVLANYLAASSDGRVGVRNWVGLFLVFAILATNQLRYHHVGYAAAAAALIVMMDAAEERCLSAYVMGALYFVAGIILRVDSLPIVFIALLALFFVCCIQQRRVRAIGLILPFILTIFVYSSQHVCSQQQMWEANESSQKQNIIDVNNARMSFCDYRDPFDSDKTEEYLKMGFTPNDKALFENFLAIHAKRSTPGWMEALHEIRQRDNQKYTFDAAVLKERFLQLSDVNVRFLILALIIGMVCILAPPPSTWRDGRLWLFLPVPLALLITIWIGRLNFSAILCISNLYLPLICYHMGKARMHSAVRHFFSLGLFFAVIIVLFVRLSPRFSPFKVKYKSYELYKMLSEECAANPHILYVWEGVIPDYYPSYSIWRKHYSSIANITEFPSYTSMWPSYQETFKRYGVESDSHLFHSPQIRFISRHTSLPLFDLICRYEKEHYGLILKQEVEKKIGSVYYIIRLDAEEEQ